MNVGEFRNLEYHDNKILYLPTGNKVNFDILFDMISKNIKFSCLLFVVIYGSALYKKTPRDLDIMVFTDHSGEKKEKILKRKSNIEKYNVCVGHEPGGWSGSSFYPSGPIYETRKRGEWNPIAIDLNIISLKSAFNELEKNGTGDNKDTCVYNSLKNGFIIVKHDKFFTERLFGIKNHNTNVLKACFFGNRWKIKNG